MVVSPAAERTNSRLHFILPHSLTGLAMRIVSSPVPLCKSESDSVPSYCVYSNLPGAVLRNLGLGLRRVSIPIAATSEFAGVKPLPGFQRPDSSMAAKISLTVIGAVAVSRTLAAASNMVSFFSVEAGAGMAGTEGEAGANSTGTAGDGTVAGSVDVIASVAAVTATAGEVGTSAGVAGTCGTSLAGTKLKRINIQNIDFHMPSPMVGGFKSR